MSHNIASVNGQDSFAYIGAAAWHGLGQQMKAGATMEQWANAAGLDYEICRAVVEYQTEGHGLRQSAGDNVLYRGDTGARIGVVSESYKIVQPMEALEFFRTFCEAETLQIETAGALSGGSIYWALAKTGRADDFGKSGVLDVINQYVLLSSSADGSRATSASINATRVVCNNTLRASDRTAKSRVSTRHSTEFNASKTAASLGLVDLDASWTKFRADMLRLQTIAMDTDATSAFFAKLLRPIAAGADKSPRAIRGLADLELSYVAAPGAAPGTAYGALQAVTHFVDHVRGNDDKRQVSAMFGQGETLKANAFETLLAMA